MIVLVFGLAVLAILAIAESVISDPKRQARRAAIRARTACQPHDGLERQMEALRLKKLAFDRRAARLSR